MEDSSNFMTSLGKRIYYARSQACFTQEYVAEMVGVSRTAIARWENGEIVPSLPHFLSLVKVLGVSSDFLLGIESGQNTWGMDLSFEAVTALKEFIKRIREEKTNESGGAENEINQ